MVDDVRDFSLPLIAAVLLLAAPRDILGAAPPGNEAPAARKQSGVPSGAPDLEVLFVASSKDPSRRFASLRVDGAEVVVAKEGDYIGTTMVKVLQIHPDSVVFGFYMESFRIAAKRR